MVYRVLGKLFWKGGIERAGIVILHRGAPNDRKFIKGGRVTCVKSGFFTSKSQAGETVIPLHRIREVHVDGKIIWKKTGKT